MTSLYAGQPTVPTGFPHMLMIPLGIIHLSSLGQSAHLQHDFASALTISVMFEQTKVLWCVHTTQPAALRSSRWWLSNFTMLPQISWGAEKLDKAKAWHMVSYRWVALTWTPDLGGSQHDMLTIFYFGTNLSVRSRGCMGCKTPNFQRQTAVSNQ